MKLLRRFLIAAMVGACVAPAFAQQDVATRVVAVECIKNAAQEFQVPANLLLGFDRAEHVGFVSECNRYRDEAMLLSAALKDSSGDVNKALSRIHAGPAGPQMRKVLAVIASRARTR